MVEEGEYRLVAKYQSLIVFEKHLWLVYNGEWK
jgi:hypothetical protein